MIRKFTSSVNLLIFFIFIGFMSLALWIRLLPMDLLHGMYQPIVLYEDPWYTVRHVEQILPHFPAYSWFDPMLSYPTGKVVDWGPTFPLFATFLAIITGASGQSEIILAINWAPVLLGLLLIPLTFLLGRLIWDNRAGLFSSLLICFMGGETLFRSSYGDVDHHMMEVVLTAGFFACYFYLLSRFHRAPGKIDNKVCEYASHEKKVIRNNKLLLTKEILISLFAGLLYYLAIMTMPTCTIIAVTVAIFTFLYPFLIHEKEKFIWLLQIHCIIFGLFIILFSISGIHVSGWSLYQYTPIHLIIPLCIIIESLIIYLVSIVFSNRKPLIYLVSILLFLSCTSLIISLIIPEITDSFVSFGSVLFGAGNNTYLIQELNRADIGSMLKIFNISLILAMFGFILLLKRFFKCQNPVHLAAICWILIYIGISILFVRFFYYGGQIIILLSGICISEIFIRLQQVSYSKPDSLCNTTLHQLIVSNRKAILITGFLLVVLMFFSIPVSLYVSTYDNPQSSVSDEWIKSLEWLKENSKTTDELYYLASSKNEFKYPENMFTVLSWWKYGNWILAIAHMSPATNPFQTNVRSVAQYLLSETNFDTEALADQMHIKYVITTNTDLFETFPQIQKWLPIAPKEDPYYFIFYQQDPRNVRMLSPMLGMKQNFFNTTLVKLHVNDGSSMVSNGSVIIQYQNTNIAGNNVALLQKMIPIDKPKTIQIISKPELYQKLVSLTYTSPITDVPALNNYRLIYESNGTRTFPGDVTLNNIKIFERVKGYTIPGTGTIEVPIVTNQGRHFTYRQQSVNGTFTLPYSTRNSPYDVHATGPYRIIETNETFDVDESQIEKYYT